ncbi:MAG: branched-chain amino acid ABC transporter permease [bacterium]
MLVQFQVVLQGVATGSLYGVLALGLQLILGSTGKVHLGVGQLAVVAALASVELSQTYGSYPLPYALGGALFLGLISVLAHPPAFWRLLSHGHAERSILLITLGGAMSLEGLTQWVWPLPLTALPVSGEIFSQAELIPFPKTKAMAFLGSLGISAFLWGILRWSRRGKALRAWNMGAEELRLVGIDPTGLGKWVTSMGLATVGVGGVLLGATQVVTVQDGLGWTIKALCLAVLGRGLSPLRTMGLGWAMGGGEALVSYWLGAQWHPLLAPGLLFLVLSSRNRRLQ